ncbi:MAG TPA: 50S ribosomal protein L3 N(5)-glutamine methyltransferase [Gammaproteobacteria bacterium]|nr:50S ribosomal protein L3 N(5)-glutamine methyltransferase [Gammaproteobacteria bacterium]
MIAGSTARELIHAGAALFTRKRLTFAHGTDNAVDEAAALVLHALGIGYDQPDSTLDRELTAAECAGIVSLLELRAATRKPAAYLLNEAWFAGLSFYVDERVLVPRSPIAELIESGFYPWVDPHRVSRVLDLCTGSGCIAVATALAVPDAAVDAADLSTDALDVARINIRRHGVEGQVNPVASDVFSGLAGQVYDIIVSNPPYVPVEEMAHLPAEFGHEPELGLVAGIDGMDIVARILRDAARHLAAGGILVVEVGHYRDNLTALFPDVPFMWLDFAYGGEGVFLLDAGQLDACQEIFKRDACRRVQSRASTGEM